METNQNIQYHRWLKDDSIKVKLERGQKGTYAFEATAEGVDDCAVVERLQTMDAMLKRAFPGATVIVAPVEEKK